MEIEAHIDGLLTKFIILILILILLLLLLIIIYKFDSIDNYVVYVTTIVHSIVLNVVFVVTNNRNAAVPPSCRCIS